MTRNVREVLASVRPLLGGTAAFVAGNSLLGIVLPLRMEAAGYPVALTGAIMAAYYLGLAFGGLRGKRVILRIGHIRAFAVFAALAAATTLAYATISHPAVWVFLRIVNGFCVAGLTATIESWLNTKSSNKTRGRILGFYMLTFYLAMAFGQTLVNLTDVGAPDLFMLSASLIVLSLVPVAMTKLGEPNLSESQVLNVKDLYSASPVGMVGAGVAGLMVGSFYALGAVFASRIGLSVSEAALFMSVVVLGGLVFQLPMGVLADRYDRRIVISVTLLVVGITWGLLAGVIASGLPFFALLIMTLGFGGAMSSIYPLCVAETFDRLERRYYVAASGRLLMIYSISATFGPLLASALMSIYGPPSFLMFESAVALLYAVFVLVRILQEPSLPVDKREKYVPLPDAAPIAMGLDPRADLDSEGEDGRA
ncbi:Predicted arabinose efflux permease, MFS family [Nitrosomonas cryotolerans]|uniref:Predicted arabinose efflux permease, MFS family n=1 Tax=Nitrosomonas cryotolerans ATCC 49181 TaxID=1131553 RepID=A0A1N6IQ05_9PROT|nr:MFS transporter [Nitrosomonas cryotolerans]SFP34857.1 Predicted arabinose efflux permease, MFS family [Nitrosomonas cryotolerans]SIO34110.1 Predicted arabinose efflux permease, MFS family [Nitrosomonas cryotolerans ATCC 49181]